MLSLAAVTRRSGSRVVRAVTAANVNVHHGVYPDDRLGANRNRSICCSSAITRPFRTNVDRSVSGSVADCWNHQSFVNLHGSLQSHSFSTAEAAVASTQTRTVDSIRNVAIVAHVDHGKTTLVDELLKASSDDSGNASSLNRLMDSGDLEKERGITITSKVTRCHYTSDGTNTTRTINVVDTPGHADFSGEVDRILSLVDGVVLVVDVGEGPMAQTKYVLRRALARGLTPIVVLNKCDRAIAHVESGECEGGVLDLFDALGADDGQMEYPTLWASAKSGWCTNDVDTAVGIVKGTVEGSETGGMTSLLDCIVEYIPPPSVEEGNGGFSMAVTGVGYDQYLGRLCTGRIHSGTISLADSVTYLSRDTDDDTSSTKQTKPKDAIESITGIFVNRGVERTPLDIPASAGDIVTLSGIPPSIKVGDTLTSTTNPRSHALPTPPLAPPTLSIEFGPNSGPLAGKEGSIVTASRVRARLVSETDNNVTLTLHTGTSEESTIVMARGELQLGILIEQMRREGYELTVSPPKIMTHRDPTTQKEMEPFEEVTIDVDSEYGGALLNLLSGGGGGGGRGGVLLEMTEDVNQGSVRMVFEIPSRGLLGFGPEAATLTRGSAVVNHVFLEMREHAGNLLGVAGDKGKLVSNASGKATLFALTSMAERGQLFVSPGDEVYPGMVVGEASRAGDMEVNPVKAKASSNMRTQAKDEKLYVPPARKMTVEELIAYMNEDEKIEVTPVSIRLRKAELDSGIRSRLARGKKSKIKAAREKKG